MAYLTDAEHARRLGGLPTATDILADNRITIQIALACTKLKRWVGTSAYAASLIEIDAARAALVAPATVIDESLLTDQARALRTAEGFLTLAGLYPALNLSTKGHGLMAGVTSEAGGDVRFRNPIEIAQMKKDAIREANSAAGPYLTIGGTLRPSAAYSRYDDGTLNT